jgi:hypothetical protein
MPHARCGRAHAGYWVVYEEFGACGVAQRLACQHSGGLYWLSNSDGENGELLNTTGSPSVEACKIKQNRRKI